MKKSQVKKLVKEALKTYAVTGDNEKDLERELGIDLEPGEKVTAEDLDIGHIDDEPGMIKQEVYDIAQYAAKLYKLLKHYEDMPEEVDFPHWWQSKIVKAKAMLSKAQHYLDFETKEPHIDSRIDMDSNTLSGIKESVVTENKQEAFDELQMIMDQLYELSDRAKMIFRSNFPTEYRRLDAYGALDFGTSSNRYDVTLEGALENLDMEDDDEDMMQESVSKALSDAIDSWTDDEKVRKAAKAFAAYKLHKKGPDPLKDLDDETYHKALDAYRDAKNMMQEESIDPQGLARYSKKDLLQAVKDLSKRRAEAAANNQQILVQIANRDIERIYKELKRKESSEDKLASLEEIGEENQDWVDQAIKDYEEMKANSRTRNDDDLEAGIK